MRTNDKSETLVITDFDHTIATTGEDLEDKTIPQLEPVQVALNTAFAMMDKYATDTLYVITGRPVSQKPLVQEWLNQRLSKQNTILICRPTDVPTNKVSEWKRKEVQRLIERPTLHVGRVVLFENNMETILEIKLVLSAHDLDYELYQVQMFPNDKATIKQQFARDSRLRNSPELVHMNTPLVEKGVHDLETTRGGHYRTDGYRG